MTDESITIFVHWFCILTTL